MTQDQDNIITMFQTTAAFLDDNNSLWSGKPPFADAVNRAKSGIEAIDTAADKQQTPTEGIAGDKAQLRTDLQDQTLVVADQLAALAAKNKDADLAAKVRMSKSSLDQLPDTDLEQTAERVVSAANANAAAIKDYGIDAPVIAALDTLRTNFAAKKTAPREAAVGRKVQTESLPALIADVRSIFRNELDKMMTIFKKTNSDFYAGSFAARIIVDKTGTQKAPTPPPTP